MNQNERIRDRYPVFDAYGEVHEFLDMEAAVGASMEERIKSIYPFIVSRVLAFSATLKPREAVNFDPEDILTELWVAIAERDSLWTPDRGKYITFAGKIIDNELCSIRDRARTIHSPRNSSSRMKKYREEEVEGTITERRAKTANAIRRTGDGATDLQLASHAEREDSEEPFDILSWAEVAAENLDAVKHAVRCLSNFEAMVVGRLSGLWGQTPASVWLIAWENDCDQVEVRRAKDRAKIKIRRHLASIGHPVVAN